MYNLGNISISSSTSTTTVACDPVSTLQETVTVAGHGFSVGDVIRRAAGGYDFAQADTENNAKAIGVVTFVSGDTFTFVTNGLAEGLPGIVAGNTYYLSTTVPGGLTDIQPPGNDIKKIILEGTAAGKGDVQIGDVFIGLYAASNNIDLTSEVNGILPISNGGTGFGTKENAFNALSPASTKGDIVISDGVTNLPIGVGSDGLPLASWSAVSKGLQYMRLWLNGAYKAVQGVLEVANGGTGASDAAQARANLGLGSLATQDSSDFASSSHAATHMGGSDPLDLSAIPGSLAASQFSDTAHGARGGGTLHINATTSKAGFMSPSDKSKLNNIEAGSTATPFATSLSSTITPGDAGAIGTTDECARVDHQHPTPSTFPPSAHSHLIADLPVAADGVSSATQLVRADDTRLSNARTSAGATLASGAIVVGNGSNVGAAVVQTNDVGFTGAGQAVVQGIRSVPIARCSKATVSWQPAALLANSYASSNLTVTGAQVGDTVVLGLPNTVMPSIIYRAFVTAPDTVSVSVYNLSASTVITPLDNYTITAIGF